MKKVLWFLAWLLGNALFDWSLVDTLIIIVISIIGSMITYENYIEKEYKQ